MKENRLGQGNC